MVNVGIGIAIDCYVWQICAMRAPRSARWYGICKTWGECLFFPYLFGTQKARLY